MIRNLKTALVALPLIAATPIACNAASFWNAAPTTASTPAYQANGDCSPAVQSAQSQMQQIVVASQVSLANNIITQPSSSISELSCLDNLLSGSLDIIFNPPSLGSIIDMLINAVCNVARNEINGEINQVTSQLSAGSIGSAGGLGIPGLSSILPGIDLGSVSGGLGVSYGGAGVGVGNTYGGNNSYTQKYNVRDQFPDIGVATGIVNSGAGYVRGLVR